MQKDNPWLTIWVAPRKTLRNLLDQNKGEWTAFWLALIGGMILGVVWWSGLLTTKDRLFFKNFAAFIVLLALGGTLGLAYLYIMGWLYCITGSWLKGKGSFKEVRYAVGWVFYPMAVANIFGIIVYLTFQHFWWNFAFSLLYLIAFTWAAIIAIKLIAEAHRFSAWQAILAIIIAGVLLFAAILIMAMLISLLRPLFQ